jgi:hypothetical protein
LIKILNEILFSPFTFFISFAKTARSPCNRFLPF